MPKKAAGRRRGRPQAQDRLRPVKVKRIPAKGPNFQRNARGLVRQVRGELGLSQAAFGRILGKSRDTVSRVERGELPVPAGLLLILGRLQKAESERRQLLAQVARDSKALPWGD